MAEASLQRSRLPGIVTFFRRHPILLFLLLTPGIPEYLSGSTPTYRLAVAPTLFLFSLALNLGLYGPGALLVREAFVRWRKGWGWATLLLLGSAYALLEEGTALSTLFNPHAGPVGVLGSYGHAFGVNWLWVIDALGIHVVYTIGLPIILLGLALPETRGRSLLSSRGIVTALLVYATDIGVLVVITNYWRTGGPLLLFAALFALLLWLVAWRLPAGILDPPVGGPRHRPLVSGLLGLAFFPILVLVPRVVEAVNGSAWFAGAAMLALSGGLFLAVRAEVGRTDNQGHLIALVFGALVPIAIVGLIENLPFPIEIVVDALFLLFFYTLWTRYRPRPGPVGRV
jgi:hypothetical protein